MKSFILSIAISFWMTPQQAVADISTQFNRAVALQQEGKLEEAAAEYRTVLKSKPDYMEAHANLGVVLARLGKYEEAVASYEAALKLSPHMAPLLFNLGVAHYRVGKFAKAIECFDKLLQQKPDFVQARQLYGLSLSALGRDEEVLRQLEPTLDAAPPDPAVLYSLGLAYLRLGKPGLRATLERLAAIPAGLPALHLLQGQAFLRDRDYDRALEELQAAAKLNADLPRLYFSLGLSHFMLGQNNEAIAAFENEVRRNPLDTPSLYYLAEAYEKNGNLKDARRWVETALKIDPQLPEANGLFGKILFKQGKADEAVKPLEFAAAKKSDDHELRYTLARVYQQLGRREDAAREFAAVQKLKAEQLKKDRANTPKP
ncbi:MAG: tetratricopeptide repeat protein [Blastocatellales bacterium]